MSLVLFSGCPPSVHVAPEWRTYGDGSDGNPVGLPNAKTFGDFMRALPEGSVVRFRPGSYFVPACATDSVEHPSNQYHWAVKPRQQFLGAGRDLTRLKVVGHENMEAARHYVAFGVKGYNTFTDGVRISGLTIDCGAELAADKAVGAITLVGSDIEVRDVRVTNWATFAPSLEAFAIALRGGHKDYGSKEKNRILDCEVSGIRAGTVRESTAIAFGAGNNLVGSGTDWTTGPWVHKDGLVRGCLVDGAGCTERVHGITVSGTLDGLVEHNMVRNCFAGMYVDSFGTHSVRFTRNTVENCDSGMMWNAASVQLHVQNLEITDNHITLSRLVNNPGGIATWVPGVNTRLNNAVGACVLLQSTKVGGVPQFAKVSIARNHLRFRWQRPNEASAPWVGYAVRAYSTGILNAVGNYLGVFPSAPVWPPGSVVQNFQEVS